MFVTNWISTTKIQKISEITNFFRHYFLSRTEVNNIQKDMIVGREKEIELLKGLLEEEESQFVAIYGRRRVGKTFLIREAFNYSFAFQHTGIYGASLKEQLSEFT